MATQCIIEANPDIAGIGVRVSIYAQALLSLTPGIHFVYHSKDLNLTLDDTGMREMTRSMLGILFTGTALLISTVVQAKLFGITVYHALIVLNLSWLNNLTAAGSLATSWGWRPGGFLPHHRKAESITYFKSKEFAAYAIHFSATGAIGMWVFNDISTFGSQKECTPSTVYWIFGHDVKVIDFGFASFWQVAFMLAVIPCWNLFAFYGICYLLSLMLLAIAWVVGALECMITRKKTYEETFASACLELIGVGIFIAPAIILDVLLILTTEMTIAHNLVSSEESRWTFGQTLALMLVVPLGWAAFKHAREVKRNVARRRAASADTSGSADMSLQPQIALNGHSLV